MRRPLLGIALAVIPGIWLGAALPQARLFPLAAAMLASAGSLLFHRAHGRRNGRPAGPRLSFAMVADVSVFIAILFVSWFGTGLRVESPSGRELSALMNRPGEGVEIIGVVSDEPETWESRHGGADALVFRMRVEKIYRAARWQKARGSARVFLRMHSDSRAPRYGDRWRLAGVLEDRAGTSPGRGAARPAGARYAFAADSSETRLLQEGQGCRLLGRCFGIRRRFAEALERGIAHRPDVTGMLQALLVGYRRGLDETTHRDFRVTGTYHILAISGLHVAVLALIIVTVLGACGISRVYWFVFLAPCLILFGLITGMRPGTVRGTIMALAFFLGPLLNRKTDIPSTFALAAVLILAADPLQLFDRGFILSFAVVAGIMVMCPALTGPVERLTAPDPLRLQPESPFAGLARRAARICLYGLAVSLAAWLSALPLIARWFNIVTPLAPITNLLLALLVPVILLAGWLSIFSGMLFPTLGGIFNHANLVLVSAMSSYIGFMARVPYASFTVQAPPLWGIALWYAALPVAFVKKAGARILGAACLVALAAAWIVFSASGVGMDIMNSGGHAVCLVNLPGSGGMLIDAGPGFNARRVVRKLRERGIGRLHALVLTRAEAGYAGGAGEVLRSMPVGELWCASTNMRSSVFMDVIALARERGVAVRELAQGDSGVLRGDVEWSVLRPLRREAYRSAEEAAMALLLRRGRSSLVFSGALPWAAALRSMEGDEPAADILIEKGGRRREDAGVRNGEMFRSRVICVSPDHPCRVFAPDGPARPPDGDVMLRPGEELRVDFRRSGARIVGGGGRWNCVCRP